MRLADIPALLVEDTIRKWRRRAIALVIAAVCAVAAVVQGFGALRLALEAALGPVLGRLTLAAIFLAIVGATILILIMLERRERAKAERSLGKDERVSMIAEAIDLGYTLARELKQPPPASAEADDIAQKSPRTKNGVRGRAAPPANEG